VNRPVLVFDGHDGCGKSTLAKAVAEREGGVVVKPFADSLGDHIAWLWRSKRFAEADALARASVERVMTSHPERLLVFDRHWATMFSVLPQGYWHSWHPLPPTVVCRADTSVVMRRLDSRGEDGGDPAVHDHFDRVYTELAGLAPAATVIDTTDTPFDECVHRAVAFAAPHTR
jgi:broad-specificity NMP kinase